MGEQFLSINNQSVEGMGSDAVTDRLQYNMLYKQKSIVLIQTWVYSRQNPEIIKLSLLWG